MDIKVYQEETRRTRAPNDNIGRGLFETDLQILNQLNEMIYIGHSADAVKRSLFYRDAKVGERLEKATKTLSGLYDQVVKMKEDQPGFTLPENDFNLLHALVGIFSEAGELMQEFVSSRVEGRPIDKVNLKEELGDILWYVSLAMDYAETNFESAAESNIEKLRKRYPDKFTTLQAVNRDEAGERKVLEA